MFWITMHGIYCDGYPAQEDGCPCTSYVGEESDRKRVLAEAERQGWLVLSRKVFCPACRKRREQAKEAGNPK